MDPLVVTDALRADALPLTTLPPAEAAQLLAAALALRPTDADAARTAQEEQTAAEGVNRREFATARSRACDAPSLTSSAPRDRGGAAAA